MKEEIRIRLKKLKASACGAGPPHFQNNNTCQNRVTGRKPKPKPFGPGSKPKPSGGGGSGSSSAAKPKPQSKPAAKPKPEPKPKPAAKPKPSGGGSAKPTAKPAAKPKPATSAKPKPSGGGGSAQRIDDLGRLPKTKPGALTQGKEEKLKDPNLGDIEKKQMASLSDGQKKAVKKYTTQGGYEGLNKGMRKCPDTLDCLSPAQKTQAKELNGAISKAKETPFDKPRDLWRGMSLPQAQADAFLSFALGNKGKEISFSGITSMSGDPGIASRFAGRSQKGKDTVMFRVKAKTGLSVSSLSKYPKEAEVLHGHGQKYRIVGVSKGFFEMPDGRFQGVPKMIELEEL